MAVFKLVGVFCKILFSTKWIKILKCLYSHSKSRHFITNIKEKIDESSNVHLLADVCQSKNQSKNLLLSVHGHPLSSNISSFKQCNYSLFKRRSTQPKITTECFKNTFFNRLVNKHDLANWCIFMMYFSFVFFFPPDSFLTLKIVNKLVVNCVVQFSTEHYS